MGNEVRNHMIEPGQARIGLLTLFFDLYLPSGKQLLEELRAFAGQVAGRIGEFAEVIHPGVCINRAEVDRATRQFEAEDVDLIVVVFLTYAPSLYVLPALQRTRRPVLLWSTQQLYAITGETTPWDTEGNHGVHGVQDLANVLRRTGRPYQVLAGHWQDAAALDALKEWCSAARVAHLAHGARVGLVGYPMENMGDFGLDETSFLAQAGVQVHHLPMRLVAERAIAAPGAAIETQMAFDREHFAVVPGVTSAQHEAGSRLEWALRSLLEERELIGFASHFLAVGEEGMLDTLPFLAASKLLGEGYGFGGEGDCTSATAVWLLRQLLLSQSGSEANFTEMFSMDFGGGTVLLSHMGEGNWRMARTDCPVDLRADPFDLVPLRLDPVALRFSLRPGPVTLFSLTTGQNGRLRFVSTEGEIVDEPPIPRLTVVHGKFRPAQPLQNFLAAWSMAGGSHHQGMAYGHLTGAISKLAQFMGIEPVTI